jgi:uncharacterized protein
MRFRHLILAAVAAALTLPAAAGATVPEGTTWQEAYIETPGEPTLHADIMIPEGKETTKNPVILSIGPYFAHDGSTLPDDPFAEGPQLRWADLIEGGKIFEKGYVLVQVDLRGFGASAGCNDFGGRGEQIDVKRAVEWAAEQPWSNGKVALWGKSYDAWTGVMGLDEKPKGLAAAVIQAPIIDGYRTLYQGGVHYGGVPGWYLTPGLYQVIDAHGPTANDNPDYIVGWATGTDPSCYATNIALQNGLQEEDDAAGFWEERKLPEAYKGTDIPILWAHGFMDANTKPDNFVDVWSPAKGFKQGWFGQFAHDRPSDEVVGRGDDWWPVAMEFLDKFVAGSSTAKPEAGNAVEVQEGDGRWRVEAQWPPADATVRRMALKGGTYTDDNSNSAEGKASTTNSGSTNPEPGKGIWSFTEPFPYDGRLAGVPMVTVNASAVSAQANMAVLLYDVAPDNKATLISRAAQKVNAESLTFDLYPNDWTIQKGHRLGVLIAPGDADWYLPTVVTGTEVTVSGGQLELPMLAYTRGDFLQEDTGSRLETRAPIDVAPFLEGNTTAFEFPAALTQRPANTQQGAVKPPASANKPANVLKLSRKVKRVKGKLRLEVIVRGAGNERVRVLLKRGNRIFSRATLRSKNGKAKGYLKLAKRGRYTLSAQTLGKLRLTGKRTISLR